MAISRFVRLSIFLCALCPMVGQAAPVNYSFYTGPNPFGSNIPALKDTILGLTVSGTFTYDNTASVGVGGTTPPGSINYDAGAVTNLTGSLGGILSFTDPLGRVVVGNEKAAGGTADVLQVRSQAPPLPSNIVGFVIGDHTLISVRIFWIEDQTGIGDFLTSDLLPPVLPTTGAHFQLQFALTANPTQIVGAANFFGVVVRSDADVDGDGIDNAIDGTLTTDESAVFSNNFTDGTTFGAIVDRSDHILQVTDDPTDGVVLSANGGTGTAHIQMCSDPVTDVFLTNGDQVIARCGSFFGTTVVGQAVVTIGTVTITIPAGGIAKIEVNLDSTLTVSNLGAEVIGVVDDGTPSNIPPNGHLITTTLPPDDDGDGVPDGLDYCPETLIPERVVVELGSNRWGLQTGIWIFTQAAPKASSNLVITTTDTRGCSCEQIVSVVGLGNGHLKNGCSTGVMLDWINNP